VRITVLSNVDEDGGERDPVVAQVASALRRGKHTVSVFGVPPDIRKLVNGLTRRKPELVFHLVEEFGDNAAGNIAVCGVLDLLGLPYTGCGAGEFYLGQDKVLAKKILAFENIPCPNFAVFGRDKAMETGGNLRMPLFVKPVAMDSSIGIGKRSLVRDAGELMKQVAKIHAECDDDALAEEFIEGREFYVAIVGNQEPIALPPIEVDFTGLPEGAPRVYDRKAKWEPGSAEHGGVKAVIADIPDDLRARLHKVSLDAYRALRVRDYGRVDLRVADTGDIYVLEVNASCYLEKNDEFAMAAREAGIEYPELIGKIVDAAISRARPRGG
jgi:D-alanine-D-alanine ligase